MSVTVLLPSVTTDDPTDLAPGQSAEGHPYLTDPAGRRLVVPEVIYDAFRDLLDALARGQAVTISCHGTELTTQQAADLLGVSRPTLIRLLDAGEIPSTRPNKHRRIKLADVEAYRQRRAVSRHEGLAAIAQVSDEMGLYDDDDDLPPLRR